MPAMNCWWSKSERQGARGVAMHRQSKSRDVKLARKRQHAGTCSRHGENKADLVQLLVKADVQGSVERCGMR